MLEYMVIDIEDNGPNYISDKLNLHARDGWRVVGINNSVIVLEREKQPTIESSDTSNSKQITYSWDF